MPVRLSSSHRLNTGEKADPYSIWPGQMLNLSLVMVIKELKAAAFL